MANSWKHLVRLGYVASALLLAASALLLPLSGLSTAAVHSTRLIYTHRVAGEPVMSLAQGLKFEFASRRSDRVIASAKGFARTAAPKVTAQPTSISVTAGQTASFRASASGSPTPTVRWRVMPAGSSSWSAIAGATSTTYSFTAQLTQSGNRYDAVFTNSSGSATTNAATLTVTPTAIPPSITTEPSPVSVTAGSVATFTAAASGNPTPTVQWQVSSNGGTTFSAISGATSTTYSFIAQASQNGDLYEAVFTNSGGNATTSAAALTVFAAPSITSQPSSQSVTAGSVATFTAAASGNPTPTVQWQVSSNGGTTFSAISGATSTTYSVSADASQNGDLFEAVFTNSQGIATTNAATLTVTAATAPQITTQPSSTSVAAGSTASFSAAASGTPTPTVQWYVSTDAGSTFSVLAGATSPTLSFTASGSQNGNEYEAVFTNSQGSATTNVATLTVAGTAPTITTQPSNVVTAVGTTATFTAAASGSPAPTAQWSYSTNGTTWTAISGATSTSYSFTVNAGENGYFYEATFTNASGSATTNAAALTVTSAPNASSSNWSGYADYGATFTGVSGSWTVPTLTCGGNATTYSSHWIGIDGASSSTVEQDGTEADCVGSTPVYDAWYEMYGDSAVNSGYEVQLSTSTNPVSPGDPMSASVSVASNVWTLSISDGSATHGWSFSTKVTFAAAQSSAEWVVERPEICSSRCSLTSLADFGSLTFTGASATTASGSEPISAFSYYDIEMVNGTTVDALPGSLTSSGTSFTDTWLHS